MRVETSSIERTESVPKEESTRKCFQILSMLVDQTILFLRRTEWRRTRGDESRRKTTERTSTSILSSHHFSPFDQTIETKEMITIVLEAERFASFQNIFQTNRTFELIVGHGRNTSSLQLADDQRERRRKTKGEERMDRVKARLFASIRFLLFSIFGIARRARRGGGGGGRRRRRGRGRDVQLGRIRRRCGTRWFFRLSIERRTRRISRDVRRRRKIRLDLRIRSIRRITDRPFSLRRRIGVFLLFDRILFASERNRTIVRRPGGQIELTKILPKKRDEIIRLPSFLLTCRSFSASIFNKCRWALLAYSNARL